MFNAIGKNCNVDEETKELFFTGAASFHPSLNLSMIKKDSQSTLVKNVNCPVLMMPAGFDPPSVGANGSVLRELKKIEGVGEKSKVVEFKKVNHGFSCRGDLKKKAVKEAYDAGMKELFQFYESCL